MPSRLCSLLLLSSLAVGCKDAPAQTQDSSATAKTDVGQGDDPLADLEDRAFPLLVWSSYRVEQEYFDKGRFDPRGQLLSATEFLGLYTPEFFAEFNEERDELRVKVRARMSTFPLGDVTTLRAATGRLEEILVFVQEVLDLEEEPLHELEYTAINGLFAPLDPHTILLSPDEHNDLGVRTRGHFGGVGAQIRAEDRRILVVRVLPGMPAEKAGVKAGDVVLKIDGAATVNMPADEAQGLLRGPVGEVVVVTVLRGEETLKFEITRDTIRIDSVTSAMLPGGIAYLNISTFQENTGEKVAEALRGGEDGSKSGPKGVVLDLRGNSGGLLTQATAVVDALVERGDLVIVRSTLGREVEEATDTVALADGTPVVVLIDEDSASAAEIVSGGLKALGRGVVLGRSSFGKGTVQMVKPASPYGRELALKMTVAEYLVSGDRSIQSLGVLPDLELLSVEMTTIPGIARYFDEERFERQRERSRTAHLPSAKHHPQLPADHVATHRLRYLWTPDIPESLREAAANEEVLDRLRDPEIRIAREVALGLAGATDGEQRAGRLREVAGRLASEEDGRIVEALAKGKVDWAGKPTEGPATLEVSARLVSKGPVGAGNPFVVSVEVQNRGETTVERVHGISDCVHDELDGIEMLVGKIEPGQKVVRDLELQVMPWHSDFTDVLAFDIHVGEPDDEPDARAELRFDVDGSERPGLAYDWWIVDDPTLAMAAPPRPEMKLLPGETSFEVKGNGDGVLQPGERVLLSFVAHNRGPGPSPDVRAILRNGSAQQGLLEEGAVTLGALAPGKSARASFGITVNDDADPTQPFEVELVVGDAHVRARAGDELRLRVLPTASSFEAKAGSVRVGSEPLRIYNGAHASSPVVVELSPGAAVPVVGQHGPWRVIAMPKDGRRLFVPADLGEWVDGKSQPKDKGLGEREPLVLPPSLTLESVPRVVSDDTFTLRGTATHPRRVRDVAVLVRPPGPSQMDHKVHYAANAVTQGAKAQSLSFETEVPLSPGGNRVTILVRDGRKVERREDVWVYREPVKK